MYEQLDIFSFLPKEFKQGDWVEKDVLGEELTFDDIEKEVGNLIVLDKSTISHEWYQVVLVKYIQINQDGRRLVFSDGKRSLGYVSEIYFDKNRTRPDRAWRLKRFEKE